MGHIDLLGVDGISKSALSDAFEQLEPVRFNRQISILVTPPEPTVIRPIGYTGIDRLGFGKYYLPPGGFVGELKDFFRGAKGVVRAGCEPITVTQAFHQVQHGQSLISVPPMYRGQGRLGNFHAGLIAVDLRCPPVCCLCSGGQTRSLVVEMPGLATSGSGKMGVTDPSRSKDRASRVWTAAYARRYWYALPFCDSHSLIDRAIMFRSYRSRSPELDHRFEFINNGFAEQVRDLNSLDSTPGDTPA